MSERAKKPRVKVRQTTDRDVSVLVDLNKAAYPGLALQNSVWSEAHLQSHLRVFPQGQLVAEVEGRIVGAAASLVVDLGPNALRHHTWAGITDSGYFTNHDPMGDTLYGADVYVHPDARSLGVGAALYAGRRRLCRKLNKRRILSGGRLWNYGDHHDTLSPEEYAYRVAKGELKDLVLSFQLREGFVLRGVMPHYLSDPRSLNHASLIEWLNPDFTPAKSGARKVRVACVQYQMRKISSFDDFAQQVDYFVDTAAGYGADFVLLPELFTVQLLSQTAALSPQEGMRQLSRYTNKFVKLMSDMAVTKGMTIIAGSHPVKKKKVLQNISFICLPSGEIVEQPKLHITPNEARWWGIQGGSSLRVIDTPTAKIGVLICYDVEFPEAVRYLSDQGAEIVFVPFCTDSRQGYMRVRLCAQARAIENQIYVAIAGNVGNLPAVENMDIQYAQAAVFTPSDFEFARDGIAAEAESNEEMLLICDLDIDDLYEARSDGSVTPHLDRRNDLFRFVSQLPEDRKSKEHPDAGPLGDQRKVTADDYPAEEL